MSELDVFAGELLTDEEHKCMALLSDVHALLLSICGNRDTRHGDMREIVSYVHQLQRVVLAQAGARAYPDRYRALGEIASQDEGVRA